MLFYNSTFESLENGENLHIEIADTIVTAIENIAYRKYSITCTKNGQPFKKEFDNIIIPEENTSRNKIFFFKRKLSKCLTPSAPNFHNLYSSFFWRNAGVLIKILHTFITADFHN